MPQEEYLRQELKAGVPGIILVLIVLLKVVIG